MKIYLKAPIFKQLKLHKSTYCVQLFGDFVKNQQITIADARQERKAIVKSVQHLELSSVPWIVLDDLGYKSREALKYSLSETFNRDSITSVVVLELLVQNS